MFKQTRQALRLAFGAFLLFAMSGSANAALINAPVPTNAFITKGGLDWAWANPLPGADLSFQSLFGWRIPTLSELLSAPRAHDFIFDGANVPRFGSDPVSGARFSAFRPDLSGAAACASAYFGLSGYNHCDWINGLGAMHNNTPWAGMPGSTGFADQLVVRTPIVPASIELTPSSLDLPEPASIALFGVGLAGIGVAARRRRQP